MKLKIAVLPGDGIGPEVTNQSIKVLNCIAEKYNHSLSHFLVPTFQSEGIQGIGRFADADIQKDVLAWAELDLKDDKEVVAFVELSYDLTPDTAAGF